MRHTEGYQPTTVGSDPTRPPSSGSSAATPTPHDMVLIETQISFGYAPPTHRLRYAIAREQAESMRFGRVPPEFDRHALMMWEQKRKRAEALARHIAAEIAHAILMAVNPEIAERP